MIQSFQHDKPKIDRTAFVHASSVLIGRVVLKKNASVWPLVVLRGDIETITIGIDSNVQDSTVMHTTKGLPVVLGRGVTIGHSAVIHGAKIGDYSLIGMSAVLLDGCVIGKECLIGAGAVVPENVRIPPRSLVLGVPGRVKRSLTADELTLLHNRARDYIRYAKEHRETSFSI